LSSIPIRMLHLFKMTAIGKALLAGGSLLFVALIVFWNMGLLPLGTGDFVFFAVLAVCVAAYRPGWAFLLLVMSLPLEAVKLTPANFGLDLRPYQFLELSLLLGLLIRFLSRRALPEFPKFGLPDALLLLVPLGSLLALINAPLVALSFKLSLVLLSLYGLYVLGRIYLRSLDDVRKALPFVFVSGVIVLFYAVFQNIWFLSDLESFQVMPGRPDGMFPEPDWLGMYLVFFGTMLLSLGATFRGGDDATGWKRIAKHGSFFVLLTALFSVLLMTVSRSAWLGMLLSGAITIGLFAYARRGTRAAETYIGGISAAFLLALALVVFVPLTRFDLFGRAESIASGDQSITVSCVREQALPEEIASVDRLGALGCQHIDLEEADAERAAGKFIATVDRPDPNVEIRKDIYRKSLKEAKEHPVFGIGWGSISSLLGTDARGAGLNASNVFLEVWLGSGTLGLVGLVSFLALVVARVSRRFFKHAVIASPPASLREALRAGEARQSMEPSGKQSFNATFPIFVLSVIPGLIVFDLFNAGILLGFLWILFAALLVNDES